MRKRLIPALLACLLLLTACGGVPEVDAAELAGCALTVTPERPGTGELARGAVDTERLREGRI